MGGYSASKFALAAYTEQLRVELAAEGLKVLLVCPGPIARDEPRRYAVGDPALPASARRPGGGVRVGSLQAGDVARRVLHAAERNRAELILPAPGEIGIRGGGDLAALGGLAGAAADVNRREGDEAGAIMPAAPNAPPDRRPGSLSNLPFCRDSGPLHWLGPTSELLAPVCRRADRSGAGLSGRPLDF